MNSPLVHAYTVVVGVNLRECVGVINGLIAEGWQPHGSPQTMTVIDPSLAMPRVEFVQAMVKVR